MIEPMELDILGTKYGLVIVNPEEDKYMKETGSAGYTRTIEKKIVIADADHLKSCEKLTREGKEKVEKETTRHEIIHAFLRESGLDGNTSVPDCGWACHEEMVDYFAIQMPKMVKVFKEAGCLDEEGEEA